MRGVAFFVKPRFAILREGTFVIKRLRKGEHKASPVARLRDRARSPVRGSS